MFSQLRKHENIISGRCAEILNNRQGSDTPRINSDVLAPSNWPVPLTEKLALFWRETYRKLKQQLQRRYPKHDWR